MFQFQLHNKIQMSSARECFIANAAAAAKCIVTAVHRRILSSALEHLKNHVALRKEDGTALQYPSRGPS